MSAPAGYKATEIGVIPLDWEAKALSSLKPFITSGSRGWAKYYAETGDAFVRITNLSRHNIYPDMSDLRCVKLPDGENEGTRTGLCNGDVLVSITADIGIIGYVDDRIPKPAYINQHIATVRVDQSEADSKYLSYFLATEGSQRRVRATTDAGAKAGMSLSGVGNLLAAFPPTVTEQSAIAEALSDVDEAIAAQEAVIAKKRALKTATMQALLSGTRRLPGFGDPAHLKQFKQTRVGKIPVDWTVSSVSDVAKITTGSRNTQDRKETGTFPFFVRSQTVERIDSYTYDCEAVLTAGDGVGTGKVFHYINGKFDCHQRVYIMSDYSGVDGKFFFRIFSQRFYERIMTMTAKSSVDSVRREMIADMQIPIPSVPEQQAIAKVISDVDADLDVQKSTLEKLHRLKTGMMQQLLTGKIRLV